MTSEQSEKIVNLPVGKRGPKKGSVHYVMVRIDILCAKFADTTTQIPVSKKFAELVGLTGSIKDTTNFETIKNEPQEKVEVMVHDFNNEE